MTAPAPTRPTILAPDAAGGQTLPMRLFGFAFCLALLLAACGDDTGGGGGDGGSGSSYDSIAALNDDLAAAGIDCALEYEGLADDSREISQCEIDGAQATLNIWYDDALLDATVEAASGSAPVAYGANWSVAVTSPQTASAVAEALGGMTAPE